jgi:hypothetical protein
MPGPGQVVGRSHAVVKIRAVVTDQRLGRLGAVTAPRWTPDGVQRSAPKPSYETVTSRST